MYFLRFPQHADTLSLFDIIRFVFVIETSVFSVRQEVGLALGLVDWSLL
jgi:hypothetical protein